MQPYGENSRMGRGTAASCRRLRVRVLYEAVKKGGTAVTVVPLIFFFCTSLCTCVFSDHRIFQKIVPVALSHCLTRTEGDTVYVMTLKTPESTTKFRKVPETTGKPESQESVSVALSHFFVNRRFQFSETQNASGIISFYPSLNKSAYI